MFSENIEIIKNSLFRYVGESTYYILFIIALLYIYICEKDKNIKTIFVYFSCFVLLVIFNPIFDMCVNPIIKSYMYWRNFWVLPVCIVMAYMGTNVIKSVPEKKKKVIVFLAIIFIIIISGKFIYTSENYTKVNNWYKISDECVEVTHIFSNIPIDNKKAMVSVDLVPYVRQIDASIKLAYSRRPGVDYQRYPILNYYNDGNVKNFVELCESQNVNIIAYDKNIELSEPLSNYGFELYDETENYDIYVFVEDLTELPSKYQKAINIVNQIPIENKKVMTDTEIVGYETLISDDIELAYTKSIDKNYEEFPILKYYNDGDIQNLVELCKEQSINIIVYDKSIPLTIAPQFYGFECFDQTEDYDIYVLADIQNN